MYDFARDGHCQSFTPPCRDSRSESPILTSPRTEASFMRKATIWAAFPAIATVLGVTLWFTLVPGRSGAG